MDRQTTSWLLGLMSEPKRRHYNYLYYTNLGFQTFLFKKQMLISVLNVFFLAFKNENPKINFNSNGIFIFTFILCRLINLFYFFCIQMYFDLLSLYRSCHLVQMSAWSLIEEMKFMINLYLLTVVDTYFLDIMT